VRLRIALAFAKQIAKSENDAEEHGQEDEQTKKVPALQHHFSASAFF